jgi:hypothetical protein
MAFLESCRFRDWDRHRFKFLLLFRADLLLCSRLFSFRQFFLFVLNALLVLGSTIALLILGSTIASLVLGSTIVLLIPGLLLSGPGFVPTQHRFICWT